jgi:hypothetical protein
VSPPTDALASIAELIDTGGQITVGRLDPIACAAIANTGYSCLAMLKDRPGESLHDLRVQARRRHRHGLEERVRFYDSRITMFPISQKRRWQ